MKYGQAEVRDPGKGPSEEAVSTWQLALGWKVEFSLSPSLKIVKSMSYIFTAQSLPNYPGFWENSITIAGADPTARLPGREAGFYDCRLQNNSYPVRTHTRG